MEDVIAQKEFRGITQDGQEITITLRIGRPFQSSDTDWSCPVALEGLYEKLSPIFAMDSFHALILAIRFLQKLLEGFVERGGKLYWANEDRDIDLKELFEIGVSFGKKQESI